MIVGGSSLIRLKKVHIISQEEIWREVHWEQKHLLLMQTESHKHKALYPICFCVSLKKKRFVFYIIIVVSWRHAEFFATKREGATHFSRTTAGMVTAPG